MTDSAIIPAHRAVVDAQDRLIRILAEQYDVELVALWSVNPTTRISSDGYFLPPIGRVYRQPAPSRTTFDDPEHNVCAFVGQVGPVDYGTWRTDAGASYVVDAQTPFGVGIYFTDAPQPDLADTLQAGFKLSPEEILLGRAYRYLGALKAALVKYGCHSAAVADVTPRADMGLGGGIESRDAGSDDLSLIGIVMLEIDVGQLVSFPSQTTLPTP